MSRGKRPFLDLLRKLPVGWHRPLAKALYWCAGRLAVIKTRQRLYTMAWDDPEDEIRSEPAGHAWLACGWSMSLLELSMQLDWDHWDHWDHWVSPVDSGEPCAVCGGWIRSFLEDIDPDNDYQPEGDQR